MIDALFNQPEYLAAKKTLDADTLRQQAIASNIANLETPGYKRLDVAASFNTELQRACAGARPAGTRRAAAQTGSGPQRRSRQSRRQHRESGE